MNMIESKDRLIVALDLPNLGEAADMVTTLAGVVDFFKIGLTLQLSPGVNEFVKQLIANQKRVFLDYKYYDVEETIRKVVAEAAKIGVTFLTVHGSGGIIEAAVRGRGNTSLKLLSVTVLTSMDANDIAEMGFQCPVEELVLHRARKALKAGCDGVIASGREARQIRSSVGDNLLIVTPAIRPKGYGTDDQKRTTSPAQAILAGADFLVVGRPITDQSDPRKAAMTILDEMQDAFDRRPLHSHASLESENRPNVV